jgi:hypothetical protein
MSDDFDDGAACAVETAALDVSSRGPFLLNTTPVKRPQQLIPLRPAGENFPRGQSGLPQMGHHANITATMSPNYGAGGPPEPHIGLEE